VQASREADRRRRVGSGVAPLSQPGRRRPQKREAASAAPPPMVTAAATTVATPSHVVGTPIGGDGVLSVRGPTVADEVRYELVPVAGAPLLSRPALRSSGFVTVVQLAKFIRGQLGLVEGMPIVITCAGEEVSEAMTLHLLVSEVWPKGDGHLVLNYRYTGDGVF
jgi:hypothetical protein